MVRLINKEMATSVKHGGNGPLFKPTKTYRRFKIQKFHPETMLRPNSLIWLNARRHSGKTIFMEYLMYYLRNQVDFAVGMSPTKSACDMFRKHIPSAFVFHEGYDPHTVDDLVNFMQMLQEKEKIRNGILCLDDCGFDSANMKSKTMREIMMNSRHFLLGVMFCLQYMKSIGPEQRDQVDYFVAFRTDDMKLKRMYYDSFFSMYPTFQDFCKVFDVCTRNYGVLIRDNSKSITDDPFSCVYMGRADLDLLQQPFRMGKQCFFDWSRKYGRTKEERWQQMMRGDNPVETVDNIVPPPKKKNRVRKTKPTCILKLPAPTTEIGGDDSGVDIVDPDDVVPPKPVGHALAVPTGVCRLPVLPREIDS